MEILPFYLNVFRIFQIFRENLDSNLGIFENLHLGGSGAETPKLANLLKIYSKNQWKPPIFWKFAPIPSDSFITMRIFLKIRVSMRGVWNSFKIQKSKKPRDKLLRVWAKNQLRFEIFEKISKFTYRNLNGKLIFYPFSIPSSRTFVIFYTSTK